MRRTRPTCTLFATLLALALIAPHAGADSSTETTTSYDYYNRARGLGIFHKLHLVAGMVITNSPQAGPDGMAPVTEELGSSVGGLFLAEGTFLEAPSIYGNFQGIEFASGLRVAPFDAFLSFGVPFSLFDLGTGGPASFRLGASFGAGLGARHVYAYLRARAAAVILPEKLDIEASVTWIPEAASAAYSGDGDFEELTSRFSAFWRRADSTDAFELYVELHRRDRRGHEQAPDMSAPFEGLDTLHQRSSLAIGAGYVW